MDGNRPLDEGGYKKEGDLKMVGDATVSNICAKFHVNVVIDYTILYLLND